MRNKHLIYRTLKFQILIILWLGLLGAGTPGLIEKENPSFILHPRIINKEFLSLLNFYVTSYTGCGGIEVSAVNESYEHQVVDLVNEIRANQEQPLPYLLLSDELTKAARYHAADMGIDGYYHHDSFDPGNPDPICLWYERISTYYPGWIEIGENIAKGQATPQQVVNAWMDNEEHAENILNENFQEIGVGYFKSEGSAPHWVQNFGTRNASLGNLPGEIQFTYSIPMEKMFPYEYVIIPVNINSQSTIRWTLSSNDSWIIFSPSSGATPDSFTVSANGFSVNSEKIYSGDLLITVTDPEDAIDSPHIINVTLKIIDDPILSVYLPVIYR
jgi:uncharacterized protein YkwD